MIETEVNLIYIQKLAHLFFSKAFVPEVKSSAVSWVGPWLCCASIACNAPGAPNTCGSNGSSFVLNLQPQMTEGFFLNFWFQKSPLTHPHSVLGKPFMLKSWDLSLLSISGPCTVAVTLCLYLWRELPYIGAGSQASDSFLLPSWGMETFQFGSPPIRSESSLGSKSRKVSMASHSCRCILLIFFLFQKNWIFVWAGGWRVSCSSSQSFDCI